jgi:hypothetical protein
MNTRTSNRTPNVTSMQNAVTKYGVRSRARPAQLLSLQTIHSARAGLARKADGSFPCTHISTEPNWLAFAAINGCMNADCGVNICSSFSFEMEKKRFSVEWIVAVLKQAELGVPVAEVIRKVEISEQTFYQ